MLKTSELYNHIHYQTSTNLTPIRDYTNDFFHEQDDKLPKFERGKIWRLQSLKYNERNTNKRPASLNLQEGVGPIPKKMSPCVNSSNQKYKNIATSKEKDSFFDLLENLHDTEVEFGKSLTLVNSIYRESLHQNKHLSTRLLKENSTNELLLFGNIDTICSISYIFATSLRSILKQDNNKDWKPPENNNPVNSIKHETKLNLSVASILEQHLFRCKSTFMSYAAGHCKQMQLYQQLTAEKRFQEWYEDCMKKAHFRPLRDLLQLPLNRVNLWLDYIDQLVKIVPSILSSEDSEKMYSIREDYINDFESNPEFDYILTPSEIIQNYDSLNDSCSEEVISTTEPLDIDITRSLTTTSSYYSECSYTETSNLTRERTVDNHLNKTSTKPAEVERNLADNIVIFKKLCRRIQNLIFFLTRLDLCAILNSDLKMFAHWERIVNIDMPEEQPFIHQGLKLNNLEMYKQNIVRMKEQITVLRLTELDIGVLDPLSNVLKHCSLVRTQIRDMKILEKDYVVYLKEKKKNIHDIKRNVIGKHYEILEISLTRELPIFIDIVQQVLTICLSKYNKIMLEYYKILSGGEEQLKQDRENKGPTYDKNVSSNLDLLQNYSISRSHVKRLIHRDWPFEDQPVIGSKIVRNLFEL
ncbi:hypothetical protein C6P45_000400 [Maudiozyma exigua]|uniref:DH domain-containing protein n=1 Tax=Maudiozyma exigua TaxID=34358 RepID=A0A9P7BCT4_MAUEX|nr:hypothetical protein C6P45_000400 [Kazachstania exigua]